MGTSAGLHRLRDVAVVTHSEREGLSSNLVCSLLRTRGGTVWIDLFALAGAAGQIVSIALASTGGFRTVPNSRSVVMTLFAPSGAAVGTLASNSQNLFTLPTTGAYTIRVSANHLSTTGSYTVRRACP